MAKHFERVVANDASAAQIAKARPHERVTYLVARAEDVELEKGSCRSRHMRAGASLVRGRRLLRARKTRPGPGGRLRRVVLRAPGIRRTAERHHLRVLRQNRRALLAAGTRSRRTGLPHAAVSFP
ncbi:MAG: hypothetical protein M5R36_02775 [Deltaproteobacteria bacterium]|nr:hypothetical protein [Deltaproteobacteria bacterium]